MLLNEVLKMPLNSDITRYQHPASFRSNPEKLRIKCSVWNHASGTAEIYRRSAAAQPRSDFRVQVVGGLKADTQERLSCTSRLPRSKTLDQIGRKRIARLDLLVAAVLFL